MLRVGAVGPPELTYRWLRNGIELADNDLYSGADTSELTINALSREVVAVYQCRVTNAAGTVTSDTAEVWNSSPRSGGRGRVVPDRPIGGGPVHVEDIRYSGPPMPR